MPGPPCLIEVAMPHILVADNIAETGLQRLKSSPQITFDVRKGLSPAELAEVIGGYDGVLIRSGVQINREALARPGQLMAIARAGVGVDNVDVAAATAAGVLVLNTPDANTISTAEHTFAMMLALHRRIPEAHQHVLSRQWKRSSLEGHQLAGSTLGIVGLGRIGQAVAHRALAFEMNVIAFDPFVKLDAALDGQVGLMPDLPSLLAASDCVTLHATLTNQTQHMIGPEELAAMKPGSRLVNCARGPLVDETALAAALKSGHLAGAAVDVYEHEPPRDSPLLDAPNVVLSPHLAASTAEAQARVSLDAVDALLAYLLRGEIRSAVNVSDLPATLTPRARGFVDLAFRMGTIISPWCAEGVERIRVTLYSEPLHEIAHTVAAQTLAAVLTPHLDVRVNLVNAMDIARRRGIVVDHLAHSVAASRAESIHILVEARGQRHEIEGTVYADGRPRVLAINGYRMEIVPAGPIVMIFNDDSPGAIGLVGRTLGEAGINIANMALSRRGRHALMVLALDTPLPAEAREALVAQRPPINGVRSVMLPPES